MPRNDRISSIVSPVHRFIWGIVLLLLFLFSEGLVVRLLQVVLFAVLAGTAGKRIRYLYFVILTLSITVFNLLTPWGEVLVAFGRFAVTRGALVNGLTKGITISGLIFVSLFSVSKNLVLPGRLGRLLGKSFYYFESLYSQKKKVHRRTFFQDVDEILLALFPSDIKPTSSAAVVKTRVPGYLAIFFTIGISLSFSMAGLFLFPFLP